MGHLACASPSGTDCSFALQAAVTQARQAVGSYRAASKTVEAVAGYLRALGDSTADATAIDLDMGVRSPPARTLGAAITWAPS